MSNQLSILTIALRVQLFLSFLFFIFSSIFLDPFQLLLNWELFLVRLQLMDFIDWLTEIYICSTE